MCLLTIIVTIKKIPDAWIISCKRGFDYVTMRSKIKKNNKYQISCHCHFLMFDVCDIPPTWCRYISNDKWCMHFITDDLLLKSAPLKLKTRQSSQQCIFVVVQLAHNNNNQGTKTEICCSNDSSSDGTWTTSPTVLFWK